MLLRIQGLRGVAIISVLLFHLWPSIFPNGYVGVDMFFVISGYLMVMIFSRHKKVTPMAILDFYYKRVKRIFPLYYLVLPLTFIASHLLLGKSWIPAVNRFGLYSLALLKNMRTIWDGGDYFLAFHSSGSQKDPFLHLWSLAVEIQFYLIVPFLFLIMNYFKHKYLKITFLAVLGAISCGQFYYSNPIFSFNYCLSRLWQFGTGMIGYFIQFQESNILEPKDKPTTLNKVITVTNGMATFAAAIPIALILAPHSISPEIIRPLATFSCFLLIVFENNFSKKALTGDIMVYIGDLSYTLYLVHWPVITFFNGSHSVQFIFALILVISMLIHTCYEDMYRAFKIKQTLLLLLALAVFNALVFTTLLYCPFVQGGIERLKSAEVDVHRKAAVEKNTVFAATSVATVAKGRYNPDYSSRFRTFQPPWGVYDYPNGTGKNKIMVVGNSYALNQANVIQEELKGNYSQFRLFTVLGFQALYDEFIQKPAETFYGQHNKAYEIIEQYQPDYLFIVTRYQIHQTRQLRGEDMTKDLLVQQYNKNLAILQNYVKKGIYVQGPTPNYPLLHINNFIDALVEGKDLQSFNLNKKGADDEMYSSWRRVQAMDCKKCHVYDILPAFSDGDKYLAYDPETLLSFFDNDIHFTLAGQERLRRIIYSPLVKELI